MERIKILIAEDEVTSQKIYKKGLDSRVFDCRIATNGHDAIAAYLENKPDIMVLDMRMPAMSGYAVLKKIREAHNDKEVVVVMATAVSDKDDVVACIQLGIQGYIVKPLKVGDIGKKVLEYLQKAQPEKVEAVLKALTQDPKPV